MDTWARDLSKYVVGAAAGALTATLYFRYAKEGRSRSLHNSAAKNSVPESKTLERDVHNFLWRRVKLGEEWVAVPSLDPQEVAHIFWALGEVDRAPQKKLDSGARDQVKQMARQMMRIRGLIKDQSTTTLARSFSGSLQTLDHVVMIIVVEAEIRPILDRLGFKEDEAMNQEFLNLARCRTGRYKSYRLTVLQVAESSIFQRHYSGYTQVAAISSLCAKLLHPDLVISFGTVGGVPVEQGSMHIGDTVLVKGCLFLDRIRTRSKDAFDWGLWGGNTVKADNMARELGLHQGPIASQIGYSVTQLQLEIIKNAGVDCLDMEAASIAQVLNQAHINMMALKVVSNGVYAGDPARMEREYHDHREVVSRKATEMLERVLDFLDGKTVAEL
eukprot:TRINITY_DN71977_c0_g1_i1.p1 TRINITY_DN71977_c0_g1~~TRINITY_DN71977_c0_g1_i1.p1  ORF type:complete len:387 (+),score=56.48 TRINITY_DN71977_c0_g1_i1:52-1212(+)